MSDTTRSSRKCCASDGSTACRESWTPTGPCFFCRPDGPVARGHGSTSDGSPSSKKAGRITAPGRSKIERAKTDGSWTVLDDVEDLVIPDDLQRALDATPAARDNFQAFSDSSKKGILWWIKSAKRAATRDKRIRETAELAAKNIRANHPQDRA